MEKLKAFLEKRKKRLFYSFSFGVAYAILDLTRKPPTWPPVEIFLYVVLFGFVGGMVFYPILCLVEKLTDRMKR